MFTKTPLSFRRRIRTAHQSGAHLRIEFRATPTSSSLPENRALFAFSLSAARVNRPILRHSLQLLVRSYSFLCCSAHPALHQIGGLLSIPAAAVPGSRVSSSPSLELFSTKKKVPSTFYHGLESTLLHRTVDLAVSPLRSPHVGTSNRRNGNDRACPARLLFP